MMTVKHPVGLIATFLWIGFVCAISFMEAWLKFRAPGVTVPLGLGIGRLVFNALNKIEWLFAIVIMANLLFAKAQIITFQNILYLIAVILLIIQTLWLLPSLDARAELLIQGHTITPSNLHYYFVGFEVIKVSCLTIFGIKQFSKT